MEKDRAIFNTEVAECTEKKRRAGGNGLCGGDHEVYYRRSIRVVKSFSITH